MARKTLQRLIWGLVMTGCLLPLLILLPAARGEALGANPLEALTHWTGQLSLSFLFVSLAISPLAQQLAWRSVLPYRRTLGLVAFFYSCVHVMLYFGLDHRFDWQLISSDLTKRPFIMAGFCAFLILVVLALTSSSRLIKWLGFRRWKALHRLVYLAAILAVIHYFWMVKADWLKPAMYAVVLFLLLTSRLKKPIKRQQPKS